MLIISLLIAAVIIAIALIITKNKKVNKLSRRFLVGLLSLIIFISPLGYYNDAAFANGNDPCATPGKDGPAEVTSVVNTYFAAAPGSTLNSGIANTTITLGVQSGSLTTVAVGDLLMIMQMQDGNINATNTDSYGDGVAGGGGTPFTSASLPPPSTGASGLIAINNSGRYEFVTVTSGTGGTGTVITIKGTGTNRGLNYTYRSIAATAAAGQRSYQVIRVPQYSSLSLGAGATAIPWNGTVGGVFAVDVAGQLAMGGTVDLYGKGFRPGAGRQISTGTGTGANTDYRTDTTALPGKNGSKGEGVAGTPKYSLQYFNPTTLAIANNNPTIAPTIVTNANEGYPNGSYGRGAPGNAGGGSTDGNNSNANDQNSGGGGGANGGDGGRGGRAWASQLATGAYGGKAFTTAEIDGGRRLIMGGGGGAGTTNNGSWSTSRTGSGNPSSFNTANSADPRSAGVYSSGGAGGGIALLRANTITGTGTIDLRGVTGLSVGRDGAGGGGAGGTAYITANSSTASITVDATGGPGGWATFQDAHGPGGGGGGGVVVRKTGLTVSSTLVGGAGGQTGSSGNTNPSNFDAAGGTGITIPIDATDSPGLTSGAICSPLLTVTKTTSTPTITKPATGAMTATYTITVTNAALKAPATNVVISDLLPSGFTYASTTSITLSALGAPAATRPTTSNPTVGDANPSWGNFTIPETESVTIVFNVSIPNAQALATYQNPATATYTDPARIVVNGTTTSTYDSASSTGEDVTIISLVPSLNIVKRITAINGTNITGFVDGPDTATSNDNDSKWPTNTQYLRGAINCNTVTPCNGGTVAPNGLLEYTIYFLSNGTGAARNIQLCDRIPANTVFQPDTYGTGSGILLGWNTTGGVLPLPDPTNSTIGAGKVALNNIPDTDAGQFLATNVSATNSPTPCNDGVSNPDGALLVRLGATTDVPNATVSGTPTNSYGFIRFQVRVK
jgi:uncharacterized repeat protein (TIGR01451 family)